MITNEIKILKGSFRDKLSKFFIFCDGFKYSNKSFKYKKNNFISKKLILY